MLSSQLEYTHVFLYGEKQLLPVHHVFLLKPPPKKMFQALLCTIINTHVNILSPFVVKIETCTQMFVFNPKGQSTLLSENPSSQEDISGVAVCLYVLL